MRTTRAFLVVGIGVLTGYGGVNGAVIGFEDFDGGAVNLQGTTNVSNFGAGGGTGNDVFGIVGNSGIGGPADVWDDSVVDNSGSGAGAADPGDVLGIAGQNTSNFFAMNDADATGVNDAVWSFNIAGAAPITDIRMDIAAMGDFEAGSTDGFRVEARIDAGGFQEIFRGRTDETISKEYRPFDDGDQVTLDDPLELFVDGVATGMFLEKSDATTGAFETFASTLLAGQTGGVLDIRISWAGTPSGGEPMGFDNITITAVPEPSSLAFVALGMVGLGTARRRRERN